MRVPEDEYKQDIHSGNRIFKHRYSSIDLMRAIEHTNTFEEFENFYTDELIEGNILLGEYLAELMRKYKVTKQELEEATGYKADYFRKVLNGTRANPDRDVLLAICVYMRASVEETQILLRYAGQQPLYARRRRDALIWYTLWKKHGLTALDIYLAERGYSTLTKPEKNDENK